MVVIGCQPLHEQRGPRGAHDLVRPSEDVGGAL